MKKENLSNITQLKILNYLIYKGGFARMNEERDLAQIALKLSVLTYQRPWEYAS